MTREQECEAIHWFLHRAQKRLNDSPELVPVKTVYGHLTLNWLRVRLEHERRNGY